jgi:hypothetical protein
MVVNLPTIEVEIVEVMTIDYAFSNKTGNFTFKNNICHLFFRRRRRPLRSKP